MWDISPWPASLASAELSQLGSVPDTLTCGDWADGLWGGYLISSEEGEYQQDQKNTVYVSPDNQTVLYNFPRFREGLQNPAFYRQPLAFMNITWEPDSSVTNTSTKRSTADSINTLSYKFGTLYNKTVILKESTMIETLKSGGKNPGRFGNGTEFEVGEKVWMCTWEKTLLEVEIMVDEYSLAFTNKDNTQHAAGSSSNEYYNEENGTTTITVSANIDGVSSAPPPPPITSSSTSSATHDTPSATFSFPPSPSPPYTHPHPQPHPRPAPAPAPAPPPPPYPSPTDTELELEIEEFEFVGDDFRTLHKRSAPGGCGNTARSHSPRQYPNKVYIKEYRPTPKRLRQVQGIDLTDLDPNGLGLPGKVICKKMVAQDDGGLRAYKGEDGEVTEVQLKEQYVLASTASERRRRRKRDDSGDGDDDGDDVGDGDGDADDGSVDDDDDDGKCQCSWET
jgi:hypothetical protein